MRNKKNTVIASEAKQSKQHSDLSHRLLRRFAPRNDAVFLITAAVALAAFARPASAEIKLIQRGDSSYVSHEGESMPASSLLKTSIKSAEKSGVSKDDKKNKKTEKTLSGTVSFIRKNKMSVEFSGGEEMYLTVDEKVQLHRAKKLSDIGQGDEVKVKYTQTYRDPEKQGGAPVILSNAVTDITFIKKAKPDTALQSEEKGL